MRFLRDLSPSAFAAGFVAVLVGFTSSVALVFQAAQAFHATPEQITSWVWALGLGMGLCSLLPSLILRMPVMVAWSTPGDRKSTRLNSSHLVISYAVFCLKKKKKTKIR